MDTTPGRNTIQLACIVLAVGLLAGSGAAQTDQPEWSDDILHRMESAAADYNSNIGTNEVGFLERYLLRNARVNLYVSDKSGSEAVFSFRTDEQLRVTDLRRAKHQNPTLQVRTSKEVVEEVSNADNKLKAVKRKIWTREIRVKRVYGIFGLVIAVGVTEIVGTAAIGAVALAAGKFGPSSALSSARSAVGRAVHRLVSAGGSVWQNLGKIAAAVTLLDQLDLLDQLQQTVSDTWDGIRTKVAGILTRLSGESPEAKQDNENREQ
ncbi:MAG: hypothetical protein ABEH66_02105 [Halobacteriales archaeon]